MLRSLTKLFSSTASARKLTDEIPQAIAEIKKLTKNGELDKALRNIANMERRYPSCSVAAITLRSQVYAIRELKGSTTVQSIKL